MKYFLSKDQVKSFISRKSLEKNESVIFKRIILEETVYFEINPYESGFVINYLELAIEKVHWDKLLLFNM